MFREAERMSFIAYAKIRYVKTNEDKVFNLKRWSVLFRKKDC